LIVLIKASLLVVLTVFSVHFRHKYIICSHFPLFVYPVPSHPGGQLKQPPRQALFVLSSLFIPKHIRFLVVSMEK